MQKKARRYPKNRAKARGSLPSPNFEKNAKASKKTGRNIHKKSEFVSRETKTKIDIEKPLPIPIELSNIWTDPVGEQSEKNPRTIETIFNSLRQKQQKALLIFLDTGNSAEAYRQVYNPGASPHLAGCCGGQVLESTGIREILELLAKRKISALYQVSQTFTEMASATKPIFKTDAEGNPVTDEKGNYVLLAHVPDWRARKDGCEGLTRIHALAQPETVKHTGSVQHNHNGSLTASIDLPELKGLLNGSARK